jgi:hypothetical protein
MALTIQARATQEAILCTQGYDIQTHPVETPPYPRCQVTAMTITELCDDYRDLNHHATHLLDAHLSLMEQLPSSRPSRCVVNWLLGG